MQTDQSKNTASFAEVRISGDKKLTYKDIVTMLSGRQRLNINVEVVVFVLRFRMKIFTTGMFFFYCYVSRLTRDEDVFCTITLCFLVNN